ASLRAQEATTQTIRAEHRPDIELSATISGRAGGGAPSGNGEPANGNGYLPDVPNWDVGVVIRWPLFDATVSARADASRAEESVRKRAVDVAQHDLNARIRLAYGAVSV